MKNVFLFAASLLTAYYFTNKNKVIINQELDTVETKNNGSNVSSLHIDWNRASDFSVDEFQNQLGCLDKNVIYALQKLRNKIGRIDISKAVGAIARTDNDSKNSMHYCGVDNGVKRLSLAIDIHPRDVDLKTAYEVAKTIPEIGAVGVYPNWHTAGLHIDLRQRKGNYTIASWADIGSGSDHNYVGVNEGFA